MYINDEETVTALAVAQRGSSQFPLDISENASKFKFFKRYTRLYKFRLIGFRYIYTHVCINLPSLLGLICRLMYF